MHKGTVGVLIMCMAAGKLVAQPDDLSLYGVPDTSRPEYAEQAYLRGEWQAKMVYIKPDGSRQPLDAPGQITAFYHSDGKTLQTCFKAPGFYSTDIQAFDEKAGKWRAHFLNATLQRWSHFFVKKSDDAMERIVPGGFAGNGADVKTIARDITDTSFIAEVYAKSEDTQGWVQTYEMTYTRAPSKKHGPLC